MLAFRNEEVALLLKCLPHKSPDLSSEPLCPHKVRGVSASAIPVLGRWGVDETSLARLMSTRFGKKPTFQKSDEERLRKVPGVNLWPPQAWEYPHKHIQS